MSPSASPKLLTVPIISLMVFVICTLCPIIYSYLPILGKIKAVLIAGIIMLISFVLTVDHYGNAGVYKNSLFRALTGLLCVIGVSLFVSMDRGKTLDLLIVNLKYFLVIAVMIKIIDSNRRLDTLLSVIAACAVVMAWKCVLNYVTGQTSSHSGYISSRALSIGIFGDPNDQALLYNTALPIVLYFWIKAKKKIWPVLCIFFLVMAIILTFSRGGFVGLCAVALGFYFFYAKKQKKYLVYSLILVVLCANFAPPEYSDRLASIVGWEVDEVTGETGTRMDAWRVVLIETLTKHPLLGVGAGSSLYIAGHSMRDWHFIHNAFLQIFSELGLVGLFFYLRLFYLPYKQYKLFMRSKKTNKTFKSDRYSSIIVCFMTYGVTVVFLPQAYSPILYLLVGIAIIQAELSLTSEMHAKP